MSITVRLKPKSYVTAYHCMACGAPCAKDTLICPYCRTRYETDAQESISFWGSDKFKVRMMMASDRNFVYFPVWELGEINEPQTIDIGQGIDGRLHRIPHLNAFPIDVKIKIPATLETLKKESKMRKEGNVQIRIEINQMDRAFRFDGYMAETRLTSVGVNEPYTLDLSVIPTKLSGWEYLRELPTDLRCPNCGAPINSRTGCCDYCTGWVEWVDGI